MPTFREDLHLGHSVPTTDTADIVDGAITNDKMADDAVGTENLQDGCVTTPKIADGAVTTPKIANCAVTFYKLANDAVGTSKIQDGAVTTQKIADGAVTNPKIKNGSVTMDKLATDVKGRLAELQTYYDHLRELWEAMQNEIESLTEGSSVPITTIFGNSNDVVISQAAITTAIQKLWGKLEDITGENYNGVTIDISPDYYIGEDGCDITLTVSNSYAVGNFDRVVVYVNGVEKYNEEGVGNQTPIVIAGIEDTSVVRCVATLLGVDYEVEKTVVHYDSYWLGAGATASDVMIFANLIPATGDMKGNYNITVENGDHIIIVMNAGFAQSFARADINGLEIPFTRTEFTDSQTGVTYAVFTSDYTYTAGEYNIDINS